MINPWIELQVSLDTAIHKQLLHANHDALSCVTTAPLTKRLVVCPVMALKVSFVIYQGVV